MALTTVTAFPHFPFCFKLPTTTSISSSVIMKNFRPPQVPTISPTVLTQSSVVQEPLGKRCLSREWTDEKHSMYLKSMEASFVNQLYNSKQVLAWRSPRAATLSHSTLTTSTQWKDLGDRYWRKNENVTSCGLGQRNQIPSASTPDVLFSDIEMTDQNFVDDDDEVVECESKNVKRLKPLISHTCMH